MLELVCVHSISMLDLLGPAALAGAGGDVALDLLWPTPLLKSHDALAAAQNKKLRKLLLSLSRSFPSERKTNIGGWQSSTDLFERTEPELVMLRTRTYHAIFRFLQSLAPTGEVGHYEVSIGSAWANVNARDSSNTPHIHPGAQLAGVYYVDDGGDREGGVRFIDPRAQARASTRSRSPAALYVSAAAWHALRCVFHPPARSQCSAAPRIVELAPTANGTQASMIPVPPRWTRGMGEHVKAQVLADQLALHSWFK